MLEWALADPLAGRSIARSVRVIAWGVAWASWLWSLVHAAFEANPYPPGYFVAAMAALALPLVIGARRLRTPEGPVRPLQALVAIGLALMAADLLLPRTARATVDYFPLGHFHTAALIVAGTVLPARTAVPTILAGSALIAAGRAGAVGLPQSLGEWAVFAAAGFASLALVSSIRGELDRLEAATSAALDAQTRAAQAARRSDVRQRLDGLIHDKVLAALTLAARGQAADAAGLAEDALTQLEPEASGASTTGRDGDAVALILDHARALGLTVALQASSWPDGAVGEALRAASCEALTNVFRHAGVREAALDAGPQDGAFVVEIADEGAGFDPNTIAAGRLGVRDRIVGSLAAIGGHARIDSAPGAGTRIVLTAPQATPAAPSSRDDWLPRVLVLIAPALALAVAGHVAVGSLHLDQGLTVWMSVVGMVAIPACTVLVAVLPVAGRAWGVTLAAMVAVWAGLYVNVADISGTDWRIWFVGAFDSALAIISARRGTRQALAVVGLATLAGFVGLALRGQTTYAHAIMSSFQCVGWAVGAGWLRGAAVRASARTDEQLRLRQAADVASAQAAALQAEITARHRGLDAAVLPTLRAIAAQTPLSDDQRIRCRDLEAATRDQLVAAALLSPQLIGAIAAARARGCRVTIVGRAEPGPGLDTFRAAAEGLLRAGRAKDRITLRWAPDAAGALATCVLAGPGAGVLELPEPSRSDAVEASVDADSILLVIRDA